MIMGLLHESPGTAPCYAEETRSGESRFNRNGLADGGVVVFVDSHNRPMTRSNWWWWEILGCYTQVIFLICVSIASFTFLSDPNNRVGKLGIDNNNNNPNLVRVFVAMRAGFAASGIALASCLICDALIRFVFNIPTIQPIEAAVIMDGEEEEEEEVNTAIEANVHRHRHRSHLDNRNAQTKRRIRARTTMISHARLTYFNLFFAPFVMQLCGVRAHLRLRYEPIDFAWFPIQLAKTESIPIILVSIVLLGLWHESFEYWEHRLMHAVPWLYRNVHSVHHRAKAPTVFTAFAMHPIEFALYVLLAHLPAAVCEIHILAFASSLGWGVLKTIYFHCGVDLNVGKWFGWAPVEFHDSHHRLLKYNYGFSTHHWDWLMGTLLLPSSLPPTASANHGVADLDSRDERRRNLDKTWNNKNKHVNGNTHAKPLSACVSLSRAAKRCVHRLVRAFVLVAVVYGILKLHHPVFIPVPPWLHLVDALNELDVWTTFDLSSFKFIRTSPSPELKASYPPQALTAWDVVLTGLHSEANLTRMGRFIASTYLQGQFTQFETTMNQIKRSREHDKPLCDSRPKRQDSPRKLMVVIGLPRSGTTLLHNALVAYGLPGQVHAPRFVDYYRGTCAQAETTMWIRGGGGSGRRSGNHSGNRDCERNSSWIAERYGDLLPTALCRRWWTRMCKSQPCVWFPFGLECSSFSVMDDLILHAERYVDAAYEQARRAVIYLEMVMMEYVVPSLGDMHRVELDQPEEDILVLGNVMSSMVLTTSFYLPSYVDWITSASGPGRELRLESVRYLRAFLDVCVPPYRHYQDHNRTAEVTVLKTPWHLLQLDDMVNEFLDVEEPEEPDVGENGKGMFGSNGRSERYSSIRFVWIHRSPREAFSSMVRLNARFFSATSKRNITNVEVLQYVGRLWLRATRLAVEARNRIQSEMNSRTQHGTCQLPRVEFIDVRFEDVVANSSQMAFRVFDAANFTLGERQQHMVPNSFVPLPAAAAAAAASRKRSFVQRAPATEQSLDGHDLNVKRTLDAMCDEYASIMSGIKRYHFIR